MVPYYIFSLFSMLVFWGLSHFVKMDGELSFPDCLLTMLYGNSRPDQMKWNTPLWFLPCLFGVLLCVYGIEKAIFLIKKSNNKLQICIRVMCVLLFLTLGIVLERTVDIRLPFQMESGVFMIGFCELGILLKLFIQRFEKIKHKTVFSIVIITVSMAAGVLLSILNGFAEVRIMSYGAYPVLFILTSVLFSISFIFVSILLDRGKLLKLVGQNTMVILVLHKFPVMFFQVMCSYTKDWLKDSGALGICVALLLSIVIVIICYFISMFINRFLLFLLGKSYQRSKSKPDGSESKTE